MRNIIASPPGSCEFTFLDAAFRFFELPRLDAITLRQLRALAAVAETGSIAAAADRLGLTPPAVHAQIRNLETALASPMLRRAETGPGSAPTPEAEVALEAARRIEIALASCIAQVGALKAGHAGRVTLGVVSTAKYFAPRLVATLPGWWNANPAELGPIPAPILAPGGILLLSTANASLEARVGATGKRVWEYGRGDGRRTTATLMPSGVAVSPSILSPPGSLGASCEARARP